jgi:hypothetical protein
MLIKETYTKQADLAIEKTLHDNNDIMKPHMFKDGNVVPIILKGTIHDVKRYWNEDARVREGFQTDYDTKTVYVPNFFVKIDGIMDSWFENRKLLKILKEDSLCINNLAFAKRSLFGKKEELKKIRKLLESYRPFGVESLKEVLEEDEIKGSIIQNLNMSQANYIFQKLNSFINIYVDQKTFDTKILLQFICNVVYMDDSIINELQNWDYPYRVPKIVFFDKYKDSDESELDYLLIHFLNYIGMDIAIVSPSGRGSIETSKCSLGSSLNTIMLDKFKKAESTPEKHPEILIVLGMFIVLISVIVGGIYLFSNFNFDIFSNDTIVEVPQEPTVPDTPEIDGNTTLFDYSDSTMGFLKTISIFGLAMTSMFTVINAIRMLMSRDEYIVIEARGMMTKGFILLVILGVINFVVPTLLNSISAMP